MKKHVTAVAIVALMAVSQFLNAQPPPPPPSGGHGSATNQPAGAPIGNGFGILLTLGAFYGSLKVYRSKPILNKNTRE